MMAVVLIAVVFWLLFNWLAPFALLSRAERMSKGRLPSDLSSMARDLNVRIYTSKLYTSGGFSVMAWPYKLVMFDRESLSRTPAWALRFLIAHELGHCALGHLHRRWWLTVTGITLLPTAQRYLQQMEKDADAFAAGITGIDPQAFYKGANA